MERHGYPCIKRMCMKATLYALLFILIAGVSATAQIKVGDRPDMISPGSVLELESTDKALTLTRLTTAQMRAIPSPLPGMIVFNTDSNCVYFCRNNRTWSPIQLGAAASVSEWPYHSNDQVVGTPGNGRGIVSVTGAGLTASGNYSHAEGLNSVAYGNFSWSSGNADTASGEAAVAMGARNRAKAPYSFAAGFQNISAYQSSATLGQENRDSGWSSLAAGLRNSIYNGVSYSHVLGYQNEIRAGSSHLALGENNVVQSGIANTLSGSNNTAAGNYHQLFGKANRVQAGSSHVAGGDNNLVKAGSASVVFGFNNVAEGNYLGAIGKDNVVFYQSAVALGQGNKDSGYASIAGGLNNTLQRNVQYAASFGQNNLSTRNTRLLGTYPGSGLFTAGVGNTNSGYASLALGGQNRSSHLYSLAANYQNLSNSFAMSVFGHFNDTIAAAPSTSFLDQEILFAVGNGVNNTERRNSLTLMRSGFTTINASGQNGPNIPRAELDVRGTGALIVPVGTTAERPASPVAGMIRFCTDCAGGPVLQGFDGTQWVNL